MQKLAAYVASAFISSSVFDPPVQSLKFLLTFDTTIQGVPEDILAMLAIFKAIILCYNINKEFKYYNYHYFHMVSI